MTLPEMVIAVLQELGAIHAEETPTAADAAFVTTRYERWRSLSEKRFIIDWDSTDDIPAGAEDAVTLIVAYHCAPAYGIPKDRQSYEDGRTMLFEYRDNWKPNQPMKMVYF